MDLNMDLNRAAFHNNFAEVEAILKAQANVNDMKTMAQKVLHTAIRVGHINMVKMLILYKADVNYKIRKSWRTQLMHAEDLRCNLQCNLHPLCDSIMTLLLNHGANINNLHRKRPVLHMALIIPKKKNYLNHIKLLVEADADIVTKFGKINPRNALDIAVKKQHISWFKNQDILEYLQHNAIYQREDEVIKILSNLIKACGLNKTIYNTHDLLIGLIIPYFTLYQ